MEGDPNLKKPDVLRSVQAAFKRHRPIRTMQSTSMLPRRSVLPQRASSEPELEAATVEAHEDASITPPSISATATTYHHNLNFDYINNQPQPQLKPHPQPQPIDINASSCVDPNHLHILDASNKLTNSLSSQGDGQMATRLDNLSSHMDSLALTEMEWEAVNRADSSNAITNEPKHYNIVSVTDGASSVIGTKISVLQNQLHHLRNFLQNDAVGSSSSCATTTSVHATSAPVLNSTTHSSCPLKDSPAVGSLAHVNLKSQNTALTDAVQQARPTSVQVSGVDADRLLCGAQASSSITNSLAHAPKSQIQDLTDRGRGDDASTVPPSKDLSSHAKLETTKSEKQEKPPSRKKGYDPDLFFKVNGKLYQRLGKIGSGGSSEVHKVISSDCTIFALKKIKLKGRDYATALGFCQEIVYLKKLKGKDNIIQLIDYEVTDKVLLHEVMNGPSSSNKDNKVKEDGFIYMVLEYGEIDLAHMLSQKWKEIERSNSTMDENWLRFYWQQILLAVNTIHDERIVHSDLKPANFLLVKGSLKLIDFGIAKAIMSDTTNIQRDAQVGTLSYMSPEAFMCNETDANGNIIKCGRPSDIWSLGCILYQMVYGRTPFSEYKTFWAKFKVITDPNHEVTYGPVSNPWLLDLMKKCLAWERNERWRIPQLLKHPFLVPPLQPAQNCKFFQMISEFCPNDSEVSSLCSELQSILGDPTTASRVEQFKLLSQISGICQRLKEHVTKTNE